MMASPCDVHWQQARLLVESFIDLPYEQALRQLESQMSLADPHVKVCARSLLQAAGQRKTLFEHIESGTLSRTIQGMTSRAGQRAGPYVIKDIIGIGGLSAVYRGVHQQRPTTPVAIKLLLPVYARDYAHWLFCRERAALSRIRHPQVVMLLDSGQLTDGGCYLVLEYVDNARSLEACAPQLTIRERVCHVLTVARAMVAVHAVGIVHNDLKPGNILVDAQGRIKIIDFGIASDWPGDDLPDSPAYTPFVAAPEQILGESITPQVDVFLLGATLLHVLTGHAPLPPFTPASYCRRRDERHVAQLLAQASIAPALKTIIRKALRTRCAARYSDMASFAGALARWLAQGC